jgi:hypothetical protein
MMSNNAYLIHQEPALIADKDNDQSENDDDDQINDKTMMIKIMI